MRQAFQKLLFIGFGVLAFCSASAQSVTPLQSIPIQQTLPAAAVVTAPVTTTTTTTTVAPTMMDLFLQQEAAQQAAVAEAATTAATAQAKAAQTAAMMQLALKACPFFQESQATKFKSESLKIQKAIGKESNQPQSPDPTVSEKDKEGNRESKAEIAVSKSCDSFIKENGEYGEMGNKVLAGIRENPESFSGNVPKDMNKICPKYASMDEEQRNKFWVWTMMSMASKASDCDSEKINEASPDSAIGLFQLSADGCSDGVDLKDAMLNADCAVNRLAKELKAKPVMISNPAVDKKALTMIRSYSECGGSQSKKKTGSNKSRSAAGKKSKPQVQ
ncbi:hypothetical protein ACLVWU_02690 [Bdellovibrio sp. HCB290]|uniref:hypothetical protein n=1 Tax=Bdellovibrio sp. HCB290 TaxID=3394356 RepID=UPI0039B49443